MKQRISFLLACVFLCLTGCRASGAEQPFFAMDTGKLSLINIMIIRSIP